MISTNVRHLGVAVLSLCVFAAVQQACGGGSSGGNGGGGGGGGPQNTQLGVSTPTPGSEATPTSVTVIIPSGADVVEAAKRLPAGATVIVPPGTYAPIVFNPGDLPGSLILIADETGTLSNGLAAPVVITARGQSSGIEINGQSDITIDGFTVHGATDTAVLVKNSPRTVVADCTLS